MSDTEKILYTSLATVLSGTTVFVIGQLIVKFLIEPIHAMWRFRGEISDSLIFYAGIYMNVGYVSKELTDEASEVFRQQACQLMSRAHLVPCYNFLERLKLVPGRQNLTEAHKELTGLSNSVYFEIGGPAEPLTRQMEWNKIRRDKIAKLLNLRI